MQAALCTVHVHESAMDDKLCAREVDATVCFLLNKLVSNERGNTLFQLLRFIPQFVPLLLAQSAHATRQIAQCFEHDPAHLAVSPLELLRRPRPLLPYMWVASFLKRADFHQWTLLALRVLRCADSCANLHERFIPQRILIAA